MPRHPFISWWLLVLSDPSTSAVLACSQPSPSSWLPSPLSLLVVDGPWLDLLLTASVDDLNPQPFYCSNLLCYATLMSSQLMASTTPQAQAPHIKTALAQLTGPPFDGPLNPLVALHQPSIMASCGPPHMQTCNVFSCPRGRSQETPLHPPCSLAHTITSLTGSRPSAVAS
ncbi:hypothetical protein GOP47_0005813 [Adiantum capillus-veneris]|uniref:Secreted protein n=1 Tax=Adiantum capillus-veneris TaxID=13818 RepID=A0A9D4ZLY2_ADICA|nr:hypothetical protein GOP47_0005813 [Adiantum capillus-veneris]